MTALPGPGTRAAVGWSTAAAAVSCLAGLGYQPLSWDEAVTANAAARSLPALWRLVSHTDAPLATYYLAMHGWMLALTGLDVRPTEGWLRLPSALAGIGAVALAALLATRWFGPRVGLLAGLLLAVHPLFVFYAHDARPYTLVTLCVLVCTLALGRALARPTGWRLALYGGSCVLVVYVHLFAVFVLAAHALVVGWRGTARWRFATVGAAVAVVAAPLLWLTLHQSGEIGWVPRPDLAGTASFLIRVAGAPTLLLAVALAALLAWSRWFPRAGHRRDNPAGREPGPVPPRFLLLGWALLPPAALLALSFAQPALVPRYALVAVPGVVIMVAAATARLDGRRALLAGAVTVLIGVGVTVVQQSQPYKYENFRAAADTVTDSAHAGDGLIFLPASFRVGYDEYLRPDGHDPTPALATDVAVRSPLRWAHDDVIGGQECAPAQLAGRIDPHERIFLVGSTLSAAIRQRHTPAEQVKEQILSRGYQQVWSSRYGDVAVTLFVRKVPTATA